ncbi:MAG: ABC transporter permease [Chloroflexi bacterium]|nr:MAG: ABC transporter permease [Chloroflexota bacterium]
MILRFLSMLSVIWLAASIAFFALRVLPGDAIEAQLAISGVSETQIEAQRDALGLNDPVIIQYGRYLAGLLRGDMGTSLISRLPVKELIFSQLHHTVLLALLTMFFGIVQAVPVGILAAQNSLIGQLARLIINLSLSMPVYWSATLVIILFSSWLGYSNSLILPVSVLSFSVMGGMAQVIYANIRQVKQATFVWVARSKGLPEYWVQSKHILRVALIPLVTVAALQTGFLLGGTVITEQIFVRPGIGRLLLDSTINQDYPVVQGIVVLSAVFYVLLNTVADLLHRLLDPRLDW